MNFSKKNHELVGQNEQNVKKPQKHDANLQKNTTLYFQVGLILTLLMTYGLLEMQFKIEDIIISKAVIFDDPEPYVNYVLEQPKEPVVEPVKVPRKKLLAINLKPVDNNTPEPIERDIIIEPVDKPVVAVKMQPKIPETPKPTVPVSFLAVEQVPIYPGCEGFSTREEFKQCMSQKIGKLIGRKFNTDIAADLGLTGKQNIYVQFTIDKSGFVTNIKARAPHSKLEKEAVKVINKIPQMIPGKQRDQNVEVFYTLPIRLQVDY